MKEGKSNAGGQSDNRGILHNEDSVLDVSYAEAEFIRSIAMLTYGFPVRMLRPVYRSTVMVGEGFVILRPSAIGRIQMAGLPQDDGSILVFYRRDQYFAMIS